MKASPGPRILPPLVLAVLMAAVWGCVSRLPLPHDDAWILDATGRWLNGARLYSDIMEINPPLIFYLSVLLSFGSAAKGAFLAGVVLAIGVSTAWCARLAGWRVGFAAFGAMVLGGAIEFGQREHLALIFLMPYLVAPKARGVGLFAFAGAALKPYFLLLPAAASLATALKARSVRPIFSAANWALGACLLAYLAFIGLAHPAYFQEILPLGLLVYGPFGADLLGSGVQYFVVIVASATIALAGFSGDARLLRLAGALAGGLGVYFLQGKGWTYHLIPAIGLSIFILALIVTGERSRPRLLSLAPLSALATFLLLNAPYRNGNGLIIPSDARSVIVLSTNVSAVYPAVFERHVRQVSRYPTLWPLPGAVAILADPSSSPRRRAAAEGAIARTRADVLADIAAGRPDYVVIDDRPFKAYFDRPFDYLAFLGGPPAGYVEVPRVGAWRRYERLGR